MVDRACTKRRRDHSTLSERHADPRDRFHHRQRFGLAHRFHVQAQWVVRVGAHRQRPSGRGPHADRTRRAIRLRLHRAVGVSATGRAASIRCRPGQSAAPDARSDTRRGYEHRRGFHAPRGRRGKLRSQLVAFVSRGSSPTLRPGTRGGAQTSPFLLDRLGGGLQASGPLGRGGSSLAADVEGARALGDRRHCRGRDDLLARTARRAAQLGLSILLASGRDLHPLCA